LLTVWEPPTYAKREVPLTFGTADLRDYSEAELIQFDPESVAVHSSTGWGIAGKMTIYTDISVESPNQTISAGEWFTQQVRSLVGVSDVRSSGTDGELYIIVIVPSLMSEVARKVYGLKGDMYRNFPGANIEIRASEDRR